MPGTGKIFVGSSREALEVAEHVKKVIENQDDMNMTAVLWNTDAFSPGETLVETIESIPFEYDGAVLLWTPDVSSKRDGYDEVRAPVAVRIRRGPV